MLLVLLTATAPAPLSPSSDKKSSFKTAADSPSLARHLEMNSSALPLPPPLLLSAPPPLSRQARRRRRSRSAAARASSAAFCDSAALAPAAAASAAAAVRSFSVAVAVASAACSRRRLRRSAGTVDRSRPSTPPLPPPPLPRPPMPPPVRLAVTGEAVAVALLPADAPRLKDSPGPVMPCRIGLAIGDCPPCPPPPPPPLDLLPRMALTLATTPLRSSSTRVEKSARLTRRSVRRRSLTAAASLDQSSRGSYTKASSRASSRVDPRRSVDKVACTKWNEMVETVSNDSHGSTDLNRTQK